VIWNGCSSVYYPNHPGSPGNKKRTPKRPLEFPDESGSNAFFRTCDRY
jgi:hypothetical protein